MQKKAPRELLHYDNTTIISDIIEQLFACCYRTIACSCGYRVQH